MNLLGRAHGKLRIAGLGLVVRSFGAAVPLLGLAP
jgi:hypothetical protein